MSIDLYSINAKLTPPKLEAVGWDCESESEAKTESEWQSEAIAESEPDWKRPRLELKDIDDVEESVVSSMSIDDDDDVYSRYVKYPPPISEVDEWYRWEPGSESESESESELQAEAKTESELQSEAIAESESDWKKPPWESKRRDDVEESELSSIYDDSPVPFHFSNKHFSYKNRAMIQHEQALAEYRERTRNQPNWPWDAPPLPPNLGLCGSVAPMDITEKDRPRLIHYCNLALNNYNADQVANFVFDGLVKSSRVLVCGWKYYITFMAKDASSDTAALTFQTEVWDHVKYEPKVILCMMKPTTQHTVMHVA